MIINESFIIFYLFWFWCMCILYKDNTLPNKLDQTEIPILQDLSECKFCMDFWSSTILAAIYSYAIGDIKVLFWGVFCSSITALFRL